MKQYCLIRNAVFFNNTREEYKYTHHVLRYWAWIHIAKNFPNCKILRKRIVYYKTKHHDTLGIVVLIKKGISS